MTEIMQTIRTVLSPENVSWVIGILAVLGIAIDITPFIKINPMRYILRQFGKLINGELYEKVDEMGKRLDKAERDSRKYRMTSLRDRIFQMHRFFMQKGKVTEDDLDNFKVCVEEYEANGGNGVVHQKIVPEVYSLPLSYNETNTPTTNKED